MPRVGVQTRDLTQPPPFAVDYSRTLWPPAANGRLRDGHRLPVQAPRERAQGRRWLPTGHGGCDRRVGADDVWSSATRSGGAGLGIPRPRDAFPSPDAGRGRCSPRTGKRRAPPVGPPIGSRGPCWAPNSLAGGAPSGAGSARPRQPAPCTRAQAFRLGLALADGWVMRAGAGERAGWKYVGSPDRARPLRVGGRPSTSTAGMVVLRTT